MRGTGGPVDVIKPDLIIDYKLNKTGLISYIATNYPFHYNSVKWWKKLFFYLFTMAVINVYIEFKERTNRKPKTQELYQTSYF